LVPTSIGTNRGTSALSASFLHINSRGFLLCDFLVARAIPLYSFTVTGMGARSPTNEEMNQRNSVFLALVMNSYLREGRRPRDPDRLERKRANELKHRARVCVECGVFPLFLTEGAAPEIPVALFPDLGESEGETRSGISRTLPSRQEPIPAGRTSTGSRSPIEKESKRRQFSCARVCRVACLSPSCARACVSSVACLFPSLPDGGRCPGNPGRALPRPRRERGRDAVWDFKNAPLSSGTHTCGKDCVHGI
jgi:hypothetical protein